MRFSFFDRRRGKKRLRAHKAALDVIEANLALNVFQDILYEDFPRVPVGLVKQTYDYGDFELKGLASFHCDRSDLSLRVKRDGVFLGTLVTKASQERFLVLPEKQRPADEIDALVTALQEICAQDAASRTRPANAA